MLRVGDALAAGPADLGQPVRDRRGGHDVARDDHEPRGAARGSSAAQAFDGDHELLRASPTPRGGVARRSGRSRVEPRAPAWPRGSARRAPSATRRSPRASFAGWTVAATGSNTPARCAGEPERRATSSGPSRSNALDPVRLARGQDAVPGADVRRRRRGPQEAAAAVVGGDPVLVAEGADRLDRGRGRAAQPDRLLRPAARDEARQLRPPRRAPCRRCGPRRRRRRRRARARRRRRRDRAA